MNLIYRLHAIKCLSRLTAALLNLPAQRRSAIVFALDNVMRISRN